MSKTATTIPFADVNDDARLQCAHLWETVWPSGEQVGDVDARLQRMATVYADQERHQWHLGIAAERVVAVGRTFHRSVRIDESPATVVALASVCSAPEVRGQHWGTAVVSAALKRSVADELPCLFQTGVPDFYVRLGAVRLSNSIVTSVPGTEPFDDDVAMVYPAGAAWPTDAVIDLLGNGW